MKEAKKECEKKEGKGKCKNKTNVELLYFL